jgi:hypothetical protein
MLRYSFTAGKRIETGQRLLRAALDRSAAAMLLG